VADDLRQQMTTTAEAMIRALLTLQDLARSTRAPGDSTQTACHLHTLHALCHMSKVMMELHKMSVCYSLGTEDCKETSDG